jgi:hypothetical protein
VRGGGDTLFGRREGTHGGKAALRLARTADIVPRLTSVDVELADEALDPANPSKVKTLVASRDRPRLNRFIIDWWQLDPPVPVEVLGGSCEPKNSVLAGGGPMRHVQVRPGTGATNRARVRWHPDRTYVDKTVAEGRVIYCEEEKEILDMICFTKEAIAPTSEPIIKAVAATLTGNPSIRVIEIRAYTSGPDAQVRTQRRAELVRDRLVALGVAPSRLRARGGGEVGVPSALPTENEGLFDEIPDKRPMCDGDPGGRVAFEILEKD